MTGKGVVRILKFTENGIIVV